VRSPVWQRITADAFGLALKVADFENAVYGAALTAAKGIGVMNSKTQKSTTQTQSSRAGNLIFFTIVFHQKEITIY